MIEVLAKEESGNYRVTMHYDQHAERPYDEGGSPILQYTAACIGESKRAHQYEDMGHWTVPADVIHALNYCTSTQVFERYMRIFHGTTKVVWKEIHYNNLVTFDTAEMREALGWGETAEPSFTEYEAWANGDVYGYVIEQQVTWTSETHGERTTWEHVDSCWGFFGYEYAQEAALEAFDHYKGGDK